MISVSISISYIILYIYIYIYIHLSIHPSICTSRYIPIYLLSYNRRERNCKELAHMSGGLASLTFVKQVRKLEQELMLPS